MPWLIPALIGAATLSPVPDSYRAEIEEFRRKRVHSLTRDEGWLAIIGLFFLKPGANTVGSGPGADVRLPASGPKRLGTFTLDGKRVTVRVDDPSGVTINGQPAASGELRPPTETRPADILRVGSLSMAVHRTGDRLAIRLRDTESPLRRDFKGLRWFEADPDYRVTARLIPDPAPRNVELVTTFGNVDTYTSEGVVEFVLHGQKLRLRPMWSEGSLFFIFRDATSGKETYPAARFLYADLPKDGATVLDFNKAYNPPCAVSPYTTCPLPPKENRLGIRIEAGEKNYEGGHPSPGPERR